MIQQSNAKYPSVVTAPTMELLAYAWRFVTTRIWLFAGLSGLLLISSAATFFAGRILLAVLGFTTSSRLQGPIDWLAGAGINTALTALVVIPIWAGLYGIVFKLLDNDPDPMKGFSTMQTRYATAVAIGVLCALPNIAIQFLLFIAFPHFAGIVLSVVVTAIIDAMLVLSLPAAIRLGLGPIDAISYSVRRFVSRPLPFLGYYLGAIVLSVAGGLACGIGILFTFGVIIVASALLLLEPTLEAKTA